MAKSTIPRGETSVIRHVFIMDSASTTGGGKTGLAYNTAGISAYYIYAGGTKTALTLEDITTLGTYAAPTSAAHMRFKLIDDTNMPGWYEVQFHNDWYSVASARKTACVQMKGASGMAPLNMEFDVVGMELQSAAPKVDVDTIKTQAVTCAAGVTVLASVGTAATSTAQTGDSYARLGAPAGASVSADVAAIKAVADTIQADTDLLDDASGGLADIHTDIADLHTDIAAIKTVVDTIQADTDLLDDVSGGLADIHTDVGSVKTVVDAIKLKTDNLPADPADDSDLDTQLAATKAVVDAIKVITDAIGATGSGLTAIPWNAAWDAEVQSECTDALNAYDPPTKAELDSAQAAVTVSAIANNAITAAAIATDAIDADALKADAITEIQNGLATAAALTTVDTVVDLIEDIVRNKMEITDANGNLVLYADDSTTPLYSVAACVTDDLTTTTRKRLA